MVVVPLYDTLGPDAIRFIINTGKHETDLPVCSFEAENNHFLTPGTTGNVEKRAGASIAMTENSDKQVVVTHQ